MLRMCGMTLALEKFKADSCKGQVNAWCVSRENLSKFLFSLPNKLKWNPKGNTLLCFSLWTLENWTRSNPIPLACIVGGGKAGWMKLNRTIMYTTMRLYTIIIMPVIPFMDQRLTAGYWLLPAFNIWLGGGCGGIFDNTAPFSLSFTRVGGLVVGFLSLSHIAFSSFGLDDVFTYSSRAEKRGCFSFPPNRAKYYYH